MNEYFIVANSFAAPFFSDNSTSYQEGESAEQALELFAERYRHPASLYAAVVYENADAYHKGKKPLAKWICNEAKFMQGKTGMINKQMIGKVQINGVMHNIDNPKEGSVIKC